MDYTDLSSVPFLQPLGSWLIPVIIVAIIWSLVLKGLALWKSARKGHKIWFVVFILVSDMGILELAYLLFFSKEKHAVLDVSPAETVE